MRWLATTALKVTWSQLLEDGESVFTSLPLSLYPSTTNYHSIRERSKNYGVLSTDVSGILCHMPSAQFSVHTAVGGEGVVHARDSPPQAASSAPLYFSVLGLYLKPRKSAQKACRWPRGVGG